MTLDDVAVSTKIGTRMLQALEDGRYDQLPGGIFNKGFVRAYARHLGLDEEKALADYVAATGPPPVEAAPVAVMEALAHHAVETRGEKLTVLDRIPWGKLAIFLLLVAIVLTIWGPHPQQSEKPRRPSAPHSEPAALPPPASSPLEPASSPRKDERNLHAITPAAFAADAPSRSPAVLAAATANFSLRIQANDDSWLSISVDGKDMPAGVLPAHAQKTIGGSHSIVVKAGNIGALDFWFNGQKLPPQGDFDQVKTLTFTPSGLHSQGVRIQPPAPQTTP